MKTFIFLLTLGAWPLMAQPVNPPAAPDPAIPTTGFAAQRYEALWTKSPFAVETSEDNTVASPDYMLVGIATIDGVSYASVIERQSQEHFLISSDKPTRGLTLMSLKRGENGTDTFASVQKDGQTLTLKLEAAPAGGAAGGVGANGPAPMISAPGSISAPQIPMPGGPGGASVRPFTRIRRSPIHLPPQPNAQTPAQPSAPPQPPPPSAPH